MILFNNSRLYKQTLYFSDFMLFYFVIFTLFFNDLNLSAFIIEHKQLENGTHICITQVLLYLCALGHVTEVRLNILVWVDYIPMACCANVEKETTTLKAVDFSDWK